MVTPLIYKQQKLLPQIYVLSLCKFDSIYIVNVEIKMETLQNAKLSKLVNHDRGCIPGSELIHWYNNCIINIELMI